MLLNETICVLGSEPSTTKILDVGPLEGKFLAAGVLIIAIIGLLIKGLFIYFVKYEAQKDRPINTMILEEQVRNHLQILSSSVDD